MERLTAIRGVGDSDQVAFVDLILSDRDLVNAEFNSIINDAWTANPPGSTSRCAVGAHEPRRPRRWALRLASPTITIDTVVRRLGRTRQRSPPMPQRRKASVVPVDPALRRVQPRSEPGQSFERTHDPNDLRTEVDGHRVGFDCDDATHAIGVVGDEFIELELLDEGLGVRPERAGGKVTARCG